MKFCLKESVATIICQSARRETKERRKKTHHKQVWGEQKAEYRKAVVLFVERLKDVCLVSHFISACLNCLQT